MMYKDLSTTLELNTIEMTSVLGGRAPINFLELGSHKQAVALHKAEKIVDRFAAGKLSAEQALNKICNRGLCNPGNSDACVCTNLAKANPELSPYIDQIFAAAA